MLYGAAWYFYNYGRGVFKGSGMSLPMFKRYQKRSFGVIVTMMMLVGGIVGGGCLYGKNWLAASYGAGGSVWLKDQVLKLLPLMLETDFHTTVFPGIVLAFVLSGVLGWLILSFFMVGIFKEQGLEDEPPRRQPQGKKDFIDHKIEQERKRRLFLHTLSVLQREGRLLDFFGEDLNHYNDAQIGAAVRSIQDDCRKAVKKYIDPKPVLEGEEGDRVTIEEGFDIDAITLVGNVSGNPPFTGVIKHPGWKAGKKEVPKLSDIQDPAVMTPAEVEIQ